MGEIRKHERQKPLGRSSHRWPITDNRVGHYVDLIHLACVGSRELGNEPSDSIKGKQFPEQLSNY
jgi:hypothetical protein